MEISVLTVILLAPAVFLLAAGVLLLVLFLLGNLMQVDVHFESSDGKWADTESTFKAYDYKIVMRSFEAYQDTASAPVSMLRTTPIDWRKFRLWPTYLMNPKWRVPYAPRRIAAHQLLSPSPRSRIDTLPAAVAGAAGGFVDAGATASAVDYLDQCIRHKSPATLVGMLGYVDFHRRVVPAVGEVNEALEKHSSMRVRRENRSVTFTQDGPDRAITEEDLQHAYREYRSTFGGTSD